MGIKLSKSGYKYYIEYMYLLVKEGCLMSTEKYDLLVNNLTVVFNNDFNRETIKNLNPNEYNLLFGLLGKLKTRGLDEITLSFEEAAMLICSGENKSSFIVRVVDSLWKKIKSTDYALCVLGREGVQPAGGVSLFSYLSADKETNLVRLKLNSDLEYFLNSFESGRYTSLRLCDFHQTRNKYGKSLHRLLAQFASTGFYKETRNGLLYKLDCPPSYDIKKFHKLVLEPAIESVKEFFPGLAVEKIKKGKVITTYKFTFDKQTRSTKWDPGFKTEKRKTKDSGKKKTQVVLYKNNFKNGYIPGNNSPVIGFNKWLTDLKIFVIYDEYFKNRFLAKNKIKELYKQFVIDESYSDMMFFAGMMEVIARDDAMNEWTLEENFSKVRHGKSRAFISQEVFNSLPEDKARELKVIYENSNNDDNDWVVI